MNDPRNNPVDIAEQQRWLGEYKDQTGLPWSQIAPKIGIPLGTLSQFPGGKYQGDNKAIAEAVYRYRQLLLSQAELAHELPEPPSYFTTPTGKRITTILTIAHRGRMAVVSGPPGTGKTQVFKHYKASLPNVWHATMKPSTKGLVPMQQEVLKAMGKPGQKGTPYALTEMIVTIVAPTSGLLIVDEADHLADSAIEELRSIHDETGIGIVLGGNDNITRRLSTGRGDAFARLASRARPRLQLGAPLEGDALALADAWKVEEEKARQFIVATAKRPGGLRICTRVMEIATMLAVMEGAAVDVGHLRDAWAELATTDQAV